MRSNTQSYNVAFRNTGAEAPGYKGVVTWTSFASKKNFDKWYDAAMQKNYEVVEEGISSKRAVELCNQTPIRSRVSAAISSATDPTTGRVDRELLGFEARKLAFAIGHSR